MGKKRRRRRYNPKIKIVLTPEQLRDMMENKLRASRIPSAKIYDRKKTNEN